MPITKSMQDLIENDISRLRSAIKSKHLSVYKELYDSILQTYDTVIPNLTAGLENSEQSVEVVASFRKKPAMRSTRLNGERLRANLGKLVTKLEIFLEDGDAPIEETSAAPPTSTLRGTPEAEPVILPPLAPDQEKIAEIIDTAIQTVEKRTDLSLERKEDFMRVLTQIKDTIFHESNKKARWKLIRPLLSWAYNQTDPSIASDVLFLISESIG